MKTVKNIMPTGNSSGASLVSVIVALGVMGIIALVMSTMFTNQFNTIMQIEQRGEIEDLRNMIRNMFNCENTVEKIGFGNPCPGGKVKIYQHSNRITPFLTSHPPFKKIDRYEIFGMCSGTAVKSFQFFVKKHKAVKDVPLFKIPIDCPG